MSSRRSTALLHLHVTMVILLSGQGLGPLLGAQGVSAEVCDHNFGHTTANCSGRGLDRVPWGLHHSIDTLELSNNRFTTLTSMAFKSYSQLQVLRLRNNTITSIHPDALANLKQLHTLDLANNHLSTIPTEVLNTLPELLTLNLAGNNFMIVPDDAFLGMEMLKSLDMSGNRISDLEPNALVGLSTLQVLKLENNALRSLHRSTFEHLSPSLQKVHLYNNPWVCDCKIRWLREWMANGTDTIWQHAGETILCDGPSITRGKTVATIPLDELACKVEMRTSGSTKVVKEGEEAVMECVYFSIPYASPIWQRNEMPINFASQPGKYSMTVEGSPLTTTRLHVKDFQYEDIMEYECLAQNVRGSDSTIFKVTLRGVPFESVSQAPHSRSSSSAGVDTKTIVVVVAVVCGIILIIVLSVLVYCCVSHIRRKEQEKRDAVVENVKKHFLANGEMQPKETNELDKSKLDQFNDDTNSESTRTNDTNATQVKQAIDAEYPNDKEPLYTFQQPSSPFANGNTYVSFGSEVIEDPELLPMYPQANSTSRYEGSQTESTTPLLDRYTPSVFDSDDPFDDSIQHPVYETATLYHPRRNHFPGVNGSVTPGTARSSTRSATFIPANSSRHPDYQDYRELRYPYNSTPQQRMLSNKKSMSVGNLGYQPPPRKPPRIFHSREYVEMSPHDTSGSASDYMTVPQQTSYYGIKPGTPV